MRILTSTSIWRTVTTLLLVISGCFFLSEAVAKSRARSTRKTWTQTSTKTSATTITPSAPIAPTAPTPASGTLSPGNPTITYSDGPLVTNETGLLGPPDCTVPNSCSDFTLTVNAASVAATKEILIQGTWTPTQDDFDMFILDASGTIEVAQNASTSNPSAVILPIPADGTVYHIVIVASVGTGTLDGLVKLIDKPSSFNQGPGPFPRYMNYPAGSNQANDAGEPSIGVDWNPNVSGLKNVEPPTKLNTGGVAFFTSNSNQWRSSFDDCS